MHSYLKYKNKIDNYVLSSNIIKIIITKIHRFLKDENENVSFNNGVIAKKVLTICAV